MWEEGVGTVLQKSICYATEKLISFNVFVICVQYFDVDIPYFWNDAKY